MASNKYYGSPIPPPNYQRRPQPNYYQGVHPIPATYPPKGGMVLPPSPSMLNEQFITPQGIQVTFNPETGQYKAYEQKTFINAPLSAHEIAIGKHQGPPTQPQFLPKNMQAQPYGPPPQGMYQQPQQRPPQQRPGMQAPPPPPQPQQFQQRPGMQAPPPPPQSQQGMYRQPQQRPPQQQMPYPQSVPLPPPQRQQQQQQQQPQQMPSYMQRFQSQKFVADPNSNRGPPPPPQLNGYNMAQAPMQQQQKTTAIPQQPPMNANPNVYNVNKPPSIQTEAQPTAVTDQEPFALPPLKSSAVPPKTNEVPKLEEIPSSSASSKVPPPTPTI
ncbi:conserved hypothetical protein [Heterostelium album PN500]|uniref:Uncharacterized protein n=1 Tax=Heterostelium pallidum (strain ATCC 26659 / Pp 5 / PN500) TaxID=670386 RepID=D3AXX9_HETP5|nr:conserved hypothetical protein [Heterostelium album PN500]EFA85806.1 conserved hypothetical protein [Heterostelium album PN500]|eukprot:XP_020437912.1 conserved hypothetical protein [Heterostelium album PN500]